MSEKVKKVKVISDLFAAIAKLGLNFTENQIEKKVNNKIAQDGALLFLKPAKDIVVALNDDNPANADQVRTLVLDWVNDDLTEYLQAVFAAYSEKVSDPSKKALLVFLSGIAIDLIQVMSDEQADNGQQIEDYFEGLLEDPQTRELLKTAFVFPLLKKAGAKDEVAKLVGGGLDLLFDSLDKN
jgi:hypothetical protein